MDSLALNLANFMSTVFEFKEKKNNMANATVICSYIIWCATLFRHVKVKYLTLKPRIEFPNTWVEYKYNGIHTPFTSGKSLNNS